MDLLSIDLIVVGVSGRSRKYTRGKRTGNFRMDQEKAKVVSPSDFTSCCNVFFSTIGLVLHETTFLLQSVVVGWWWLIDAGHGSHR